MRQESVPQPRRRAVLRAFAGASVAGLAGCTGLPNGLSSVESELAPTQSATFTPPDASTYLFGEAVALADDGATVLIAAMDDDPNPTWGGAAYVFERRGSEWAEAGKLNPRDINEGDEFGRSIALTDDGTTALIGTPLHDGPNGESAGTAYVFERTSDRWTEAAKLHPADGDRQDLFGHSVGLAADGKTALIGAIWDDDPNGKNAGAAYVFERPSDGWTEAAKLAPTDGDSDDWFGESVALTDDGDTALIGAFWDDDPNGKESGAGYVFERTDDGWTEAAKLVPTDGDPSDRFGKSVALANNGATALIGAEWDDDPNGRRAGAAYVFERTNGRWTETAKLTASDGGIYDGFGDSIALAAQDDIALIGAGGHDGPNGKNTGAAYVFEWGDGEWSEAAKLTLDDVNKGDFFGESVALTDDGTTALIGADHDEEDTGAAYIYDLY